MDLSLNSLTVKSVASDYSWDKLNPTESTLISSNLSGGRFVGYAPLVSVLLSACCVEDLSGQAIAFRGIADYGDFYNSETSTQVSTTSGTQIFCHNYLMPGVYTLTYKQTTYIPTDVTKCGSGVYNPYDTYVEKEDLKAVRPPFSWIWYNFFKDDYDPRTEKLGSFEPRNELITWDDCVFQGSKQITWEEASGPAIEIRHSPVSWQWKKIKTVPEPFELYTQNISWADSKPNSLFPRTWKQIKKYKCLVSDSTATKCLELVPSLSTVTHTQTLTSFLEVLEIPPKAYITAIHSQPVVNRVSPYTVTLTPRNIRCGSFPIEKIMWDLGDGSPIVEKTRLNPNRAYRSDIKFVYQKEFDSDFLDPRNFDLVYTYNRTVNTSNCFYPSLTAIASSTGTSDCATTVIGPIKYQPHSSDSFALTQNYITEKGVAYAGYVQNTASFWNRTK
jgi:hypothetical protein